MNVIAHSLDGCLRLRALTKGKAVIEIRSHLYPGSWRWCAWRSLPLEKAWEYFTLQCAHHVDSTRFFSPVVNPGV